MTAIEALRELLDAYDDLHDAYNSDSEPDENGLIAENARFELARRNARAALAKEPAVPEPVTFPPPCYHVEWNDLGIGTVVDTPSENSAPLWGARAVEKLKTAYLAERQARLARADRAAVPVSAEPVAPVAFDAVRDDLNAFREVCKFINATPVCASMLYDMNLLPEQTMCDAENWHRTVVVACVVKSHLEALTTPPAVPVSGVASFRQWWEKLSDSDNWPDTTQEAAEMAWHAALATAVPLVEPAGWKLVPIEPTTEMCEACLKEARFQFDHGITIDAAVHLYRAMLAAAPSVGS